MVVPEHGNTTDRSRTLDVIRRRAARGGRQRQGTGSVNGAAAGTPGVARNWLSRALSGDFLLLPERENQLSERGANDVNSPIISGAQITFSKVSLRGRWDPSRKFSAKKKRPGAALWVAVGNVEGCRGLGQLGQGFDVARGTRRNPGTWGTRDEFRCRDSNSDSGIQSLLAGARRW